MPPAESRDRVGELAQPRPHRVGRHDEIGGRQRVQLVVGVEPGGLPHRVGLAADVVEVVDVLEEPTVVAHRVAHRGRQRSARRLVGQRRTRPRTATPSCRRPRPSSARSSRRAPRGSGCRRCGAARHRARARPPATPRRRGGALRRRARRRSTARPAARAPRAASATWRRSGEPSTMSSCTSVPRCSSSTAAAPRTASDAVAVASELEHHPGAVARSGRRRSGPSTPATGSPNVATTCWSRRSTSASREASSATRRDVSRLRPPAPRPEPTSDDRCGLTAASAPAETPGDGRPHPRSARPPRGRVARSASARPSATTSARSPSSTPAPTGPRTG